MRTAVHGWSVRTGFTLIELLLVLFFLGLMTVGFVGVAGRGTGASVIAEADILRGNLGFVQALALANNTVTCRINFASASYSLQTNSSGTARVKFPGEASSTRTLPSGIRIASGTGSLVFDQWGAPAITWIVRLSDGTRSEAITITRFTGFVQ